MKVQEAKLLKNFDIPVWENPTHRDTKALVDRFDDLRGLVCANGNVYVWVADRVTHGWMADQVVRIFGNAFRMVATMYIQPLTSRLGASEWTLNMRKYDDFNMGVRTHADIDLSTFPHVTAITKTPINEGVSGWGYWIDSDGKILRVGIHGHHDIKGVAEGLLAGWIRILAVQPDYAHKTSRGKSIFIAHFFRKLVSPKALAKVLPLLKQSGDFEDYAIDAMTYGSKDDLDNVINRHDFAHSNSLKFTPDRRVFINRIREFIQERSVNEAQFRKPIEMYHGTRSVFLPRILKHGMRPTPKKKVWDSDPDAREVGQSRERLNGSYWTSNLGTARLSAIKTKDKFGGNTLYVIAQIREGRAYADEDRVNPAFTWSEWMRIRYGVIRDAYRRPAYDWFVKHNQQDMIKSFAQIMHRDFVGAEQQPINYKLAESLLFAMMMRGLSYQMGKKNTWYSPFENFPEGTVPEVPSSQEAETNLLRVKEQLTRTYRNSAYLQKASFNHTLRMTHPVGFSGANKIITILEDQSPRFFNKGTEAEFKKPLLLVYGSAVPAKFKQEWTTRKGTWYGVIDRNGRMISLPEKRANESIREAVETLPGINGTSLEVIHNPVGQQVMNWAKKTQASTLRYMISKAGRDMWVWDGYAANHDHVYAALKMSRTDFIDMGLMTVYNDNAVIVPSPEIVAGVVQFRRIAALPVWQRAMRDIKWKLSRHVQESAAYQPSALGSNFWINANTGELISADDHWNGHTGIVIQHPDTFGVDPMEAEMLSHEIPGEENDTLYNNVFSGIKSAGWVRVQNALGHVILDTYSLEIARDALAHIVKQEIVKSVDIELRGNAFHELKSPKRVSLFLKTGKIPMITEAYSEIERKPKRKSGAGCIVMARRTGRILLAKRSREVDESGTWATFGGEIKPSESPREAALRELREETKLIQTHVEAIPLFVYEDELPFRYTTFLTLVQDEYHPRLNYERSDYKWFEPGKWPTPLHPGLKKLLKRQKAQSLIRKKQRLYRKED